MCLSTVSRDSKDEENICAQYVAQIEVEGDMLTFTDVMGLVTKVQGTLRSADLTAGVVIFTAA